MQNAIAIIIRHRRKTLYKIAIHKIITLKENIYLKDIENV